MSEANAEDGLFRQERTKYDRMDETNIVFVFSENKPVFPKTGSDRNPLFHSESDIPARSEKENRKWQSGVRAGAPSPRGAIGSLGILFKISSSV